MRVDVDLHDSDEGGKTAREGVSKAISPARERNGVRTSTGVFMAMTPSRRMISGELATCCDRRRSRSW